MADQFVQEVVLQGEKDVVSALQRIGKAGDQAFGTLQTGVRKVDTAKLENGLNSAGTAGQRFFAAIRTFGGGLGQAVGSINLAGGAVGNFVSHLTLASERIAATHFGVGRLTRGLPILGVATVAVAGGLLALAINAARATDNIVDGAAKVGATTETYQQVGFVLRALGLTGDQAATAIGTFGDRMEKAREAARAGGVQVRSVADGMDDLSRRTGIVVQQVGSLSRIGVAGIGQFSAGALQKLDPVERLFAQLPTMIDPLTEKLTQSKESWLAFAEALAAIPTRAERARTVIAMFGQEIGRKLLPFLERGASGVQELLDRYKLFGLGVTQVERDTAAAWSQTTAEFGEAWSTLIRVVGIQFTPLLTSAVRALTDFLANNRDEIVQFAIGFAQAMVSFGTSVAQAAPAVAGAFKAIVTVLDRVATAINTLTGGWASLSGTSLLLVIVLGTITGIFSTLAAIIGGVVSAVAFLVATFGALPAAIIAATIAIGALIAAFWPEIKTAFTQASAVIGAWWDWLVAGFTQAVAAVVAVLSGINTALTNSVLAVNQFIASIPAAVVAAFNAVKDFVVGIWDSITSYIGGKIDAIKSFFGGLIEAARNAASAIASVFGSSQSAQSANAGGVYTEGYARGGIVRGPGSGTSDNLLAWLSPGEAVLRAAAVRKYGINLIDMINRLQLPAFAAGGFAGIMPAPLAAAPAFAASSPASASRVLNLTIGGETFAGLIAPEVVAQKLTRVATKSQIRSMGRKPSWVR